MKPEYRIVFSIIDVTNDEPVASGSTYLMNEKRARSVFGLEELQEESAETEFWSVLRHFRKVQPKYEEEHYSEKEEEEV